MSINIQHTAVLQARRELAVLRKHLIESEGREADIRLGIPVIVRELEKASVASTREARLHDLESAHRRLGDVTRLIAHLRDEIAAKEVELRECEATFARELERRRTEGIDIG